MMTPASPGSVIPGRLGNDGNDGIHELKCDCHGDYAPNCWPLTRERLKWVPMSAESREPRELLEQTAAQLRGAVEELAAQLDPFPAFMGMMSLQAIELEPPPDSKREWGCIVALPDGAICELELEVIPGPAGPSDVDQVDTYKPLELSAEDYIHFAASALQAMGRELERRGRER